MSIRMIRSRNSCGAAKWMMRVHKNWQFSKECYRRTFYRLAGIRLIAFQTTSAETWRLRRHRVSWACATDLLPDFRHG